MDIKGLPHLDEIQGIVLCAVLESSSAKPLDFVDFAKFTMRHKIIDIHKQRNFNYMESKNVWYEYFVPESFELNGDSLQVKLVTNIGLFIISFGVHIIYKHKENANDHPGRTRVTSSCSLEATHRFREIPSIEDESDEESEYFMGSIKEDE